MGSRNYHFYRYRGSDIVDLLSWLRPFRERYQRAVRDDLQRFIGDREKLHSVDTIISETRKGMRSPFNIESSILLFFFEGHIYVKFFVADHLFEKTKTTLNAHFTDCSYDDSGDRPDDISEEEWEERERVFTQIATSGGSWSKAGLSFDILNESDAFSIVFA